LGTLVWWLLPYGGHVTTQQTASSGKEAGMIRFLISPALMIAAALAVSGCSNPSEVSRSAPFAALIPEFDTPAEDWSIEALEVVVPPSLSVSEANSIKPRADLVWRGDAYGDRHAQVKELMQSALDPVLRPRAGAATPVIVSWEITRFHPISELARYTIGGAHEIEFLLAVRHAETGAVLSGPRAVDVTFRAAGGRQAIEEEARGRTQRVVVTEHLQSWALTEFATVQQDVVAVAQQQN
jgi:hypothetical protein